MSNDPGEYLFTKRVVDEDAYDDDELRAARMRLGLTQRVTKKRGKRRKRRFFAPSNLVAKAAYAAMEDRVLDAKASEHKVSECRYCHEDIWLDLFGEQWKAEGGSPVCGKAPFMTHEALDG